ncbi:DUF4625 domain-containing protein [Marinifilum sp. N1E240]|uniref:DUF4625 domain-containing protein n=1 Tax=Marinifilum sp. N1E240 TaxID=2608082 RepID=UPI00128D31D3|nr:DUF4625 domain-containing protein [Marinifilum sp. N1E240]MPQ46853.1 DUF4625 domain-containing protein [Marinifilum sp. N1E240]
MRIKNTIINQSFISLFCFLIFISCGGGSDDKIVEEDTIAPNVSILNPTENQMVKAGEQLSLQVKLNDNKELLSYVIKIDYSGLKSMKSVQEFSFNSLTDNDANGNPFPTVEGKKSAEISTSIEIDDAAMEGKYLLNCTVVDKFDNKVEKSISFSIER